MHSERRQSARRSPDAEEPLARVRLRAGSQLSVVDLSNSGVLVEGLARLLPGTHVDVHVVTADGRVLVRSRVVRAYVVHVEAESIRYRGALAFERAIVTARSGYPVPSILTPPSSSPGSSSDDARRRKPSTESDHDIVQETIVKTVPNLDRIKIRDEGAPSLPPPGADTR